MEQTFKTARTTCVNALSAQRTSHVLAAECSLVSGIGLWEGKGECREMGTRLGEMEKMEVAGYGSRKVFVDLSLQGPWILLQGIWNVLCRP